MFYKKFRFKGIYYNLGKYCFDINCIDQYNVTPQDIILQKITPSELKRPDFKVSTKYFFCEQDSKWVFGDSDDYFYEEVERKE